MGVLCTNLFALLHQVLYLVPSSLPFVWPLAPCAPSCVGCYLVGFAAAIVYCTFLFPTLPYPILTCSA